MASRPELLALKFGEERKEEREREENKRKAKEMAGRKTEENLERVLFQ